MVKQKLWTKEIEAMAKKYPLYSQDGKGMDAVVIAKYFNPYGRGTWLITEAEQDENGEWILYGYCNIFEWEWGYVSLKELEETKVNVFGCKLPLERDMYIGKGKTVKDLING